MNIRKSTLDDPDYAAFVWKRYRRLMAWMALASAAASALGLWLIQLYSGPVSWVAAIMIVVGTFLTIMLGAALMGLVFLSAGSGHDDAIEDPFAEDH